MPQTLMPLSDADYQVINSSFWDIQKYIESLPEIHQYHVVNVTHRLGDVEWITETLEQQVKNRNGPILTEGLLSLQVYLLLTCADTLGHLITSGGVWDRFNSFFVNMPQDAKDNLINNILTWKTDFATLVTHKLADPNKNTVFYPTYQQIVQVTQGLSSGDRLMTVTEFLYARRNEYTHESNYPQLGHHPNLSVMQRQRLHIPNTSQLGELDRIQVLFWKNHYYFAYYETDDLITTIRWSILRSLGELLGTI